MKKLTLGLQTLVAGVVLFGLTHSASAGFVPVFVSENTSGPFSVFNYNIVFSTNAGSETLTSGDFFTLYDVGTYSGGSITGVFSNSSQNTGVTATFTAPPDSPSILNLTNTYGGSTVSTDTTYNASFFFLGTLSQTIGYYSSTDTTALGKNSQAGRVIVPYIAVPEPGTVATLMLGAAGLTALGLRRRRSA